MGLDTNNNKAFQIAVWTIFIVAIVGSLIWMRNAGTAQKPTTSSVADTDLLTVVADDYATGLAGATVTVIEYLDFECEACGAYFPLVKRLSQEYKDKVLFVSRYFPLPGHKNGMTSALAVEAAGRQGKYWEMYDLVFEEQKKWGERSAADPTIFERYAEQLGLDMERFRQDVGSQEVKDRVLRDRDSGNQLGVNGTPSFFLNGKKIQNPQGYEAFKALLDNALAQ